MTIDALLSALAAGTPSIDERLRVLDTRARRFQRRYRIVVLMAVSGGLLSLVFSFAAISFDSHRWLVIGEVASLGLMLAGVIYGRLFRVHERWMLERHRAERLRLLRYAWLIDPRHWCLPADALPALVESLTLEAQKAEAADEAEMRRWLHDARWPKVTMPPHPIDDQFVTAICDHYVSTRLNDQLAYFLHMADRRERLDAVTRVLPLAGFAIAIGLSVVHLTNEWFAGGAPVPVGAIDAPGGWLLFSILVLPTAGTAARLLRTAFEFARNRHRFMVTAAELDRTHGRLEEVTEPDRVARAMARAEFALANEHRAWLLLMREAEWFG